MKLFWKQINHKLGRKGISVLLSAMLLLSMLPIGVFTWAQESNLVENGSFDEGVTGWEDFAPQVTSGGAVTADNGYAEIDASESADFAMQTAADALIEVAGEGSYTLTYRVKCADGSLMPEILQFTAAGTAASVPVAGLSAYVREGVTDWTTVTASFTAAADTAYVRIRFTATGTAQVDDVTLREALSSTANLLSTYTLSTGYEDLIANGNMSVASGWSAYGATLEYAADGGHDGQALKIPYTHAGTNTDYTLRMVNTKVAVMPETEYTFKAWIKTTAATRYYMQVVEYDSANAATYHTLYATGTSFPVNYSQDWVEISLVFTTGADAAEVLPQIVFKDLSSTRDLYVDDVSLKATLPDPNMLGLVPNGDMEVPAGWTTTTAGLTPTYVADAGHDGQALKIPYVHGGTNVSTNVRLTESKLAVQPSTTYIFSMWLKTSVATRYSMQIVEYSTANVASYHTLYATGTSFPVNYSQDWVEVTFEFTTAADAAEILPQIMLRDLSSTRDIFLDDVSITAKPIQPNMLGLIPNGDMALPSGWTTTAAGLIPTYVENAGHDGQALKIPYVHGGTNIHTNVRLIESKLAVQPSTHYTFSAWFKVSAATRFALQVVEYDNANSPTYHTSYKTGTEFNVIYSTDWVYYELNFQTGESAAQVLPQIVLRDLSSTRDILLDDVSLVVDLTPPDPNVLFEDDMEGAEGGWKLNNTTDGLSWVDGGYESDTALKTSTSAATDILMPDPREFEVQPNTGYIMEAWVKTENAVAGSSDLFLQVVQRQTMTTNTAVNAYTSGVHHRDAPAEWKRITVRFITEADAKFVIPQVYFTKGAENAVLYLDNVKLYKDDTVVKVGPTDNFGFEYADDGYPTTWTANGANGATLTYGVSADAVEGKQSAYMAVAGGSVDQIVTAALHSSYFEVKPSTAYEVAARIKLVGNYSTTLTIYASNHKADSTNCSQASCWANTAYRIENTTDGWTEIRLPLTTPADVVYWRLHFSLGGYDNILYVDDVRVTEINLTPNFDFEEAMGNRPASWYYTVYGDTDFDQVVMDYDHYHNGKSSVYLDFAAVETSLNSGYRAASALLENPVLFAVEPDCYHQTSVWFKSRNAIGMPYLNLNLTLYNSKGEYVTNVMGEKVYLDTNSEAGDWVQATQNVYVPDSAVYACAWVSVSPGAGELWVDDIDVYVTQKNGTADKTVSIHDFTAVDEADNICGWTVETVKGNPTFAIEEMSDGAVGTLTVPAGAEGWMTAKLIDMLGGNNYEITGVYTASADMDAVLRFYDNRGKLIEGADVTATIKSTGGAWGEFSIAFTAPSHTTAKLSLGGKAGVLRVETVTTVMHGSTASTTDWEGQWVWYQEIPRETAQAQSRFFREVFYLEDTPTAAPMQMTADDKCTIYINGEQVYSNMDAPVDTWSEMKFIDLLPYLKKGENTIAVEVYNRTTDAGLLYDCRISMENGDMYKLLSGAQIKSSLVSEHNWNLPGFDDTEWKPVRVFGSPPISPWGNIYFDNSHYVDCLMEVVEFDIPREVVAGTELTADMVMRVSKQPSKDFDITFNYIVRNNTKQVGSAHAEIVEGPKPTEWEVGKDIKLKLRFVVPDFVGEGRYNIMMEDSYVIITNQDAVDNQFATIRVQGNDEAQTALNAEVKIYNGAPTIFINGEPQSALLTHPTGYEAALDAESYSKFYEIADIDLGTGSSSFSRGSSTVLWRSDGSIDFEAFDNQILSMLSTSPNMRLLLSLTIDVPQWWYDQYPDELHYHDTGNSTREQALSSEKWREDMGDVLARLMQHMKEAPYYGRIYGILLCSGQTTEWLSWKSYEDGVGSLWDYGPSALRAFRKYLRKTYNNDVKQLRAAWNDPDVTFDTAKLPTPEEMIQSDLITIFDPGTQQKCIDFNASSSRAITESLLHFSKVVKENTDDKLIVGAYNAYLNHITGGSSNGQAVVAMQELYSSEYIDFFTSCISYGERDFGNGGGVMSILEGAQANGKLIIFENDVRTASVTPTYTMSYDSNVGHVYTMEDTIKSFRRDFSNVLTNGAGMWYYDMTGYYYRDNQMFQEFALQKMEMDFSLNVDRSSNAEVALIYDEDFVTYLTLNGINSATTTYIYRYQREQLNSTGVHYDSYTLGDLTNGTVTRDYKVYIMMSPYMVTDEEAAAIDKYLKNEGKTVVWIYMPAVSDGSKIDLDRASEIIGMDIGMNLKSAMLQTQIATDVDHPLLEGVKGIRYGNLSSVGGPQMYVDDPEAIALGNLVGEEYTALALKEQDDWTSIYAATPNMTNTLLRNIFEYSGVHMYTDGVGDVVFANKHYVSLHSVHGGEKTIHLDGTYSVYDVYAGEIISWATDTITFDLVENDTRLFRLMKPNKVYVTVDVVGDKGGIATPEGMTELDKNGNLTVTVTTDEGYQLSTLTVNGVETELTNGKLVFTNLSENKAVRIKFAKILELIPEKEEEPPTEDTPLTEPPAAAPEEEAPLEDPEDGSDKKQQIIVYYDSNYTYNWPAIIALGVGGLLALGAVIFLIIFLVKRKKKKEESTATPQSEE